MQKYDYNVRTIDTEGEEFMKKKTIAGWIISLVLIGLMAQTAELSGIRELIFPEMAALLTGSFLMKQRPWNVKHGMYTLIMSLSAFAGILISRYAGTPLYFKVLLATAAVFAILFLSRMTMLPAISACVLPVLIGSTAWIYVASVAIIAGICDLGNAVMEQTGLMMKKEYEPVKRNAAHWAVMLMVFAVVLLLPMGTGFHYMVAPPLIVAFVTLSGTTVREVHPPVQTILLFTGTALAGYFCRILSDGTVLPETFWIVAAAACAWTLFTLTGRFFPPASALAVLPFLLPEEGLWQYPFEVLAGIALLYLAACVADALEKKGNLNKWKASV